MSGEQEDQPPTTPMIVIKTEESYIQTKSGEKKNMKKTSEKQKEELIRFFESNPDYGKIFAPLLSHFCTVT